MAITGTQASSESDLLDASTKYLSLHAGHLNLSDSAVSRSRAVHDKQTGFSAFLLPTSHPAPVVYTNSHRGNVIAFYSLGEHLAGHPGILHGGASVVLLDEVMSRAAVSRLPSRKVAVTVALELKYKAPVYLTSDDNEHGDSHEKRAFVAICAEVQQVSGRKAEVTGYVADIETGQRVVEGSGIFVEPRGAGQDN
jgi:acyl-coenzyme A thioesterase PaaI-like protein